LALSHAEFAYNRSKNKTTQLSPFEIVYEQNPSRVLNLAPILRIGRLSIKSDEMADYLQGIHDQVKKTIEDSNATYKAHFDSHKRNVTFEVGDLVWVVLTCDHFPVTNYNKLRESKIGLCRR
jgi:hypothetical protein